MPSGGENEFVALRAAESGLRDGTLAAPVWRKAPSYALNIAADHVKSGKRIEESGTAQLAWDDRFFYVGVRFDDSDIVAEGDSDWLQHNRMGDVCEVMIKPEDQTWYWELYVTPRGHTGAFFFPGRGRLVLPSCLEYRCGIKVAAHVDGTLNDWRTRDRGWTGELAMPVSDLTAHGERFGPGSTWRVLIARYNYSRFLNTRGPELSTTPQLSLADFHRFEEYARIKFE